jgi:hypothetical protein
LGVFALENRLFCGYQAKSTFIFVHLRLNFGFSNVPPEGHRNDLRHRRGQDKLREEKSALHHVKDFSLALEMTGSK